MDKETKQQPFKEHESVKKNNNGSMAQNLDEMKKLGKEMNNMKTGSQQLEDENLIPDPIQQLKHFNNGPSQGDRYFWLEKEQKYDE